MQLNQAEISRQSPFVYLLTGVVDFSTVPGLLLQTLDLLKTNNKPTGEKITVDMAKVTACNSAGLALILEMAKAAQTNSLGLHFKNLPDSLLVIARAYGVEEEIRDLLK